MRVRLKRERLLDLIARSNLSQNHWAMKLGLSRGHWSDLVNGRHPYPSAKTRERVLEAFNVPFEELFAVESGPSGWSDHNFQAAISDRYLIDRELGQGGMGTVYVARDVKLGRLVAIKVVSPEAVSGIGVQQFLKEIRYTARLEHHHILPLYDAGEVAGHPYYVMPYVRGGSLRNLLERRQRLSVDQAVRIARGIGAALTYAHHNHVLHCDVKPANVLLSGDHAFVADFGIARAIHSEAFEWGKRSEIDTSAGTPAYVSPEQASGERHLDARSDVYSLACMVFEMLSGQPPFTGDTTMAIVSRRFASDPPDLRELVPRVPLRVARALRRGMALHSERRHQSAAALVESLERGSAHQASRLRERVELLGYRLALSVRRVLRRLPTGAEPVVRPHRVRNKVRNMLGSIRQDITYALRAFSRAPVFAAVVILTLGFGIAANSVVFSLMNPYFFRPLPFGDADRLVQLGQVDLIRGWDGVRFSQPQLRDYKERSRAFEDLAAYYYGSKNLTGVEGPERILTSSVTANMFSVLQAEPALGRTFLPDEGDAGAANVLILDSGLWQRRYGGDPEIIGKTITIDGASHTVVGVMPRRFVFPFGGIDAWVPIREDPIRDTRDRMGRLIVGRMNPGWTIETARQELNDIQRQLAQLHPDEDGLYAGISVKPLREALNFAWDVLRIMFTLLLVAVGFALVLACVNVASLFLARSTARTSEVAVRTALGAGRGRLVRQFLTEGLVLAVAGGALGVAIAHGGARVGGPLIPEDLYRVGEASVDGNVLLFTMVVTLATVVFFGLVPALAVTRTDLSTALKEGGRGGLGLRSMRARRALVVLEVALAVVLVSGMGLAAKSLLAAQRVDLGFQPDPVMVFVATPPRSDYPEMESVQAYFDRATVEVNAVPGVRAVATAGTLPQNHENFLDQFAPADRSYTSREDWPVALFNRVSPDYFDVMSIPLVAGRDFEATDGPQAPPVVIVSERLANSYWPGESALGRSLLFGDPHDSIASATVVGVVGDVKHEGIATDEHQQIYRPLAQGSSRRRFLVAAAHGAATSVARPVRQALLDVDQDLPVTTLTMNSIVEQNALPWRISSMLLAVLGGASLLLASMGIYGVIAYSVAQRHQEIGVRMALGATGAHVRFAFVKEGLKLGSIGIGIGLVLAAVANHGLASVLLGVGRLDTVTLGSVLALFVGVAVLASLVPAIRASGVDPVDALRYE
ncbi:MAG: protein kinase [Gemmatimonadales bacterium]|nr:protein kinase [Gemmatimonadales bacterium]NIN10878.1 protein kinase [Gemmatimonadales bacterium]NIR02886.1 protein kinase [Gemmatimonadales bacterium]NIS66520.1 protein kinase [Gemmatimonadales bacterium]